MGLTTTELNAMLDARTYNAMSLHTADPGSTGANEVSGGSYARATGLTFGAASAGRRTCTTQPTLDVPAGTTVAYIGLWNSSTFVGSYNATDEVFAAAGTYTITGPGGTGNPYVELS
ncbi:MAG: hypothetical protein V3573_14450 [Desulfovibrionaceae bacterium]